MDEDRHDVPLREYVEAVFAEHEKAARALAAAHRQATEAALASAVRLCSERRTAIADAMAAINARIDEADARLRDHISAQFGQIAAALDAAQREASARDTTLEQHVESVAAQAAERLAGMQREMTIQREADALAIAKAEASTDRRFEAAKVATETRLAAIEGRVQDLAQKVDKIA